MDQQMKRALDFLGVGRAIPALEEQGVVTFDDLDMVRQEDIDNMVKDHGMPYMVGKLLKQKLPWWLGGHPRFNHAPFRDLGNVSCNNFDFNRRYDYHPMNPRRGWTTILQYFGRDMHIVEKLLDHGADVNVVNSDGMGLLHDITSTGYDPQDMPALSQEVNLLLEKGADINLRDPDGNTPLFDAMHNPLMGVFQMFVEKGANLDIRNNRGQTVLDCAREDFPDGHEMRTFIEALYAELERRRYVAKWTHVMCFAMKSSI